MTPLVARRVKAKMPPVVGVPDMVPVALFNDKPGGSAPLAIDHVIVGAPVADGVKL